MTGNTAIDLSQRSALLVRHGLLSGEYLKFCDDEILDELSAILKPIPRRLFEYHRCKLSRPFLDANISTHQTTEVANERVLTNCTTHAVNSYPNGQKTEESVELESTSSVKLAGSGNLLVVQFTESESARETDSQKSTTDKSDVANSYKNNNSKEELVLEHVLEYAR
jgi:hypothetical protein